MVFHLFYFFFSFSLFLEKKKKEPKHLYGNAYLPKYLYLHTSYSVVGWFFMTSNTLMQHSLQTLPYSFVTIRELISPFCMLCSLRTLSKLVTARKGKYFICRIFFLLVPKFFAIILCQFIPLPKKVKRKNSVQKPW